MKHYSSNEVSYAKTGPKYDQPIDFRKFNDENTLNYRQNCHTQETQCKSWKYSNF